MTDTIQAQKKTRGLGRGLNALFEDEEGDYPQVSKGGSAEANLSGKIGGGRKIQTLNIDQLKPGKYQPRQTFNLDAIKDLSESIKNYGMLQPIVVRALTQPDGQAAGYEIVAGERRWRAAQQAQLHEVPVIIREFSDHQALHIALVENLQREDLNPIDEAQGYQRLMGEFMYTQEQVAENVGRSRSHIANTIRLLSLPANVQRYVLDGKLSSGHARALITAKDPDALAQEIMTKNLSVRQAEKLAAEQSGRPVKGKAGGGGAAAAPKDSDTVALEREVSNALGMKVAINSPDNKSGDVRIEFRDLDQLDEIIKRLSNTGGGRLIG